MSDLKYWNVLEKLRPDFVLTIKMVCIYGNGNSVIVVTKNDNVFAFGNNNYGCLGIGNDRSVQEPTQIREPSNKKIVNIASSDYHLIVNTSSGEVFSWGYNRDGQLGIGTTDKCDRPKLITGLVDLRIVDISCGNAHSLALTSSGDVYSWGQNSYGQTGTGNNTEDQLTPCKIIDLGEQIIQVSCGYHHSIALSKTGHLFYWGSFHDGSYYEGDDKKQMTPIPINGLDGIDIKKVVCGTHHSLLLSNEGDIYGIGNNKYGQLGNGNNINQNLPVKIETSIKFADIGSHSRSNISMAIDRLTANCLVWGECQNEVITTPKETDFQSMHDIFAIHSKVKITFKPMCLDETPAVNPIVEALSRAFNDSESSDFKFKIEDRYIYVHKPFLEMRCKHFRRMFSKEWLELESSEIEIDVYSFDVYFAFIKYIYTNCVDIKLKDAFDLYHLANSYFEDDLKLKSSQLIIKQITVENAFELYSSSIKYKCEELEYFCLKFAVKNLKDVCLTPAFDNIEPELCKRFMKNWAKILPSK